MDDIDITFMENYRLAMKKKKSSLLQSHSGLENNLRPCFMCTIVCNGNLQPFVLIVGRTQPVFEGLQFFNFALGPASLRYADPSGPQKQVSSARRLEPSGRNIPLQTMVHIKQGRRLLFQT